MLSTKLHCEFIAYGRHVLAIVLLEYLHRNFNQTLMERGLGPIPNDLQMNIADSDLLTACGITTPETCPSSLPQEQRDTSYAQRDVAVPLTTLLAAIISTVAYFY